MAFLVIIALTISGFVAAEFVKTVGAAKSWDVYEKDFDWIRDYNTNVLTQETVDRVEQIFVDFFKTQTRRELFERALEEGVMLAPVNNIEDLWKWEQLRARGFWVEIEHPELGKTLPYAGAFVDMSESPCGPYRRAPLIGEHNEEIYLKECGLSREELILLKQASII